MTWLPLLTPNLLEAARPIQQKYPNSQHNHIVGHTKLAYHLPRFHLPVLNSYFYHYRFLADVARFAVTLAPSMTLMILRAYDAVERAKNASSPLPGGRER